MDRQKIIEKTISLINKSRELSETFTPPSYNRVGVTKYHLDNGLTLDSYNGLIAINFYNEKIMIIRESEVGTVYDAIYALQAKLKQDAINNFLSV